MSIGLNDPLTWLVVALLPDHPTLLGAPLVIFGRASYDGDADLLTVTTILPTSREKEVTQGAGSDLQCLAKTLLREMHKRGGVTS
ncbi:hypothetical protein CJ010_09745 [Azoarcus sp. DD4]|uniref:hypothetical protein n=1 Tax=Azoarcus sp. DD4 TaxID=2027405 RepID=UPI001125B61F|nr:hypothetical protein [Azoarcus sp. DD4]QDF96791.1 hypothetical protein CJ010_09745 [Azoarcus sp. DD4]